MASLVPRSGLSHQEARVSDFLQNGTETECCRRIMYKLNAECSGIDVRVQAQPNVSQKVGQRCSLRR